MNIIHKRVAAGIIVALLFATSFLAQPASAQAAPAPSLSLAGPQPPS